MFWFRNSEFLDLLSWNVKNHEKKRRTLEETVTHKIKNRFRFWLWISSPQNILAESEIFFNLFKRYWWSKPYAPVPYHTPVPAFSKQWDFIFKNEIFLNFAHGFRTLKREFLLHIFIAKIQLPVLWPISGWDLFNFLKITEVINFREQ